MAAGGEQGNDVGGGLGVGEDLYAVLGLKKECSAADLRIAYKKLALRWHPDRCSALGSSKTVEEAKTKFQAIQEAYSVLSDTNKRFMYDVGVYDDDNAAAAAAADGMGDFLSEMAAMMSQPNHNPCDQSVSQDQSGGGDFRTAAGTVRGDVPGRHGRLLRRRRRRGDHRHRFVAGPWRWRRRLRSPLHVQRHLLLRHCCCFFLRQL